MIDLKMRVYLSLLSEMSRKTKLDFRKSYNHEGLVKHGLYAHWVFGGISDSGVDAMLEACEDLDVGEAVDYFCNYSIEGFKDAVNRMGKGEEFSCNLLNPDKSEGVYTNYSGGGLDPWGYIGFILKPKVVTAGYDTNVGIKLVDVGGGRRRKREKFSDFDGDERRDFLNKSLSGVRSKFPLDDEEAYLKSPEGFYHGISEFLVVPEKIVGIIYLGGEFYFDDFIADAFADKDLGSLGLSPESLLSKKKNEEKKFLKSFCQARGIDFWETEDSMIYDVPRTSLDLK